jgi:hypothetical protein
VDLTVVREHDEVTGPVAPVGRIPVVAGGCCDAVGDHERFGGEVVAAMGIPGSCYVDWSGLPVAAFGGNREEMSVVSAVPIPSSGVGTRGERTNDSSAVLNVSGKSLPRFSANEVPR